MRFYPNSDPFIYWEIPESWNMYCHNPHMTWHKPQMEPKHSIQYWRDLSGAKMDRILHKDLCLKDWSKSRIRHQACLPLYYCGGNRFIRLENAFPKPFKCSPMPMSLEEVRKVTARLEKLARKEEKLRKLKKLKKSN